MTSRKSKRRTTSSATIALGTHIRALRTAKGWSQEELADRAGLHVTYLSGLERGRRNPTLNVITDIARALHLPTWKLLRSLPSE